jgi:hypothetical protein
MSSIHEKWGDDEKRHAKALKKLSDQTYFRLSTNDWVGLFRDEQFLEERYIRSKKFQQSQPKKRLKTSRNTCTSNKKCLFKCIFLREFGSIFYIS